MCFKLRVQLNIQTIKPEVKPRSFTISNSLKCPRGHLFLEGGGVTTKGLQEADFHSCAEIWSIDTHSNHSLTTHAIEPSCWEELHPRLSFALFQGLALSEPHKECSCKILILLNITVFKQYALFQKLNCTVSEWESRHLEGILLFFPYPSWNQEVNSSNCRTEDSDLRH